MEHVGVPWTFPRTVGGRSMGVPLDDRGPIPGAIFLLTERPPPPPASPHASAVACLSLPTDTNATQNVNNNDNDTSGVISALEKSEDSSPLAPVLPRPLRLAADDLRVGVPGQEFGDGGVRPPLFWWPALEPTREGPAPSEINTTMRGYLQEENGARTCCATAPMGPISFRPSRHN